MGANVAVLAKTPLENIEKTILVISKGRLETQGLIIGHILKTILMLKDDKEKIDTVGFFAQALIDTEGDVNEANKMLQEYLQKPSNKP